VPPARPDLLADALERLTDANLRAVMGEAGRTKVRTSYDISKLGQQVRAVLAAMPGCRT
jgi:glycosyltransferase involved in cell wall biosynthesis